MLGAGLTARTQNVLSVLCKYKVIISLTSFASTVIDTKILQKSFYNYLPLKGDPRLYSQVEVEGCSH